MLIACLSDIGSPHHFIAQRIKKDVIVAFYHLDAIVSFANSEASGFFARLASSVHGH